MLRHRDYWEGLRASRKCVLFGLVAEPGDPHAIGILELTETEDPNSVTQDDPVVTEGRGFRYEIHPMPGLRARD